MKVMADGELVAAVQAGDSAAFGELFERYQTKIYNFCYGILGNPDDARDATQDAFIRVYEAMPRKEHLEFSAYLYRTARNLSYDVAKARGRYTTPEALETIAGVERAPRSGALDAVLRAALRRARCRGLSSGGLPRGAHAARGPGAVAIKRSPTRWTCPATPWA